MKTLFLLLVICVPQIVIGQTLNEKWENETRQYLDAMIPKRSAGYLSDYKIKRHVHFNPQDFQDGKGSVDITMVRLFLSFIGNYTNPDGVYIDHLKKPHEYKKVLTLFNDPEHGWKKKYDTYKKENPENSETEPNSYPSRIKDDVLYKNIAFYTTLIIEAKYKTSDFAKFAINNKYALNEVDFNQKILFVCYLINCSEKLRSAYKAQVSNTNYSQFGKKLQSIENLYQISNSTNSSVDDLSPLDRVINVIQENLKHSDKLTQYGTTPHRLGVIDYSNQITNILKFSDPLVGNHVIYLFEKPSWESNIVEIAHYSSFNITRNKQVKHSTVDDAFIEGLYYDSDKNQGAYVSGFNKDWINVGTQKQNKWVHVSQLGHFMDQLNNVNPGKLVQVIHQEFYDSFEGKKVGLGKYGGKLKGSQAYILEKKWSKNTLWLKVKFGIDDQINSTDNSFEEINQFKDSDLPVFWIPAGTNDEENVDMNFYMC